MAQVQVGVAPDLMVARVQVREEEDGEGCDAQEGEV